MDIAGSLFLLLVCSPVLFAVALAVRLSSRGPVLYRQQRVGQFGKPFTFLKFRSMYVDNDSAVHQKYVMQLIAGKAERHPTDSDGGRHRSLQADEGSNGSRASAHFCGAPVLMNCRNSSMY